MKTTLQFLLIFFCTISLSAQNNITIKINHFLGDELFEYDVESKNDLDNDFKLNRLEYYLSTFSITHDGGQITNIDDMYVLVNLSSNEVTEIDLGMFDIENIESVNFYFGIDEEANHGDPSLWPMDHALAPKFPSMHWGWAAGYRFIALEGLSGPITDQTLQFHCIGDEFYEQLNFPVTQNDNNNHVVEINAEYSNLLSNIDISGGLILHGNLGHIVTLSDNLKNKVFTSAETTSVEDNALVNSFEVFPNPTADGYISLKTDVIGNDNTLTVIDAMGRTIIATSSKTQSLYLQESGLYYINLLDVKGNTLASRKVVVQ